MLKILTCVRLMTELPQIYIYIYIYIYITIFCCHFKKEKFMLFLTKLYKHFIMGSTEIPMPHIKLLSVWCK